MTMYYETTTSVTSGSLPVPALDCGRRCGPASHPDHLWRTPQRRQSSDRHRIPPYPAAHIQGLRVTASHSFQRDHDTEIPAADIYTDTSCKSASVCYPGRSNTPSH